ncbi:hypothetical protein [Neorhizobium petrolearium]|uniref:hypothetical protein n=1 Tax=Neorhizobium petrolearium TaxID=515361 RepID=UPI003F159A1E
MNGRTFEALARAGLANMGGAGGRNASANTVTRSQRARRRAFNREADAALRRHERRFGPIGDLPITSEGFEARAADDPVFAQLFAELRTLEGKWF